MDRLTRFGNAGIFYCVYAIVGCAVVVNLVASPRCYEKTPAMNNVADRIVMRDVLSIFFGTYRH